MASSTTARSSPRARPTDLKRSVGADVIVARVDGDAAGVADAVRAVDGVQEVEVHGNELVVTTDAGSATISPVAVALANCEVPVRDLTLRTPTLDDVFLELTGQPHRARRIRR